MADNLTFEKILADIDKVTNFLACNEPNLKLNSNQLLQICSDPFYERMYFKPMLAEARMPQIHIIRNFPKRIHNRNKNNRKFSYHMRIQKKWIKKYGWAYDNKYAYKNVKNNTIHMTEVAFSMLLREEKIKSIKQKML